MDDSAAADGSSSSQGASNAPCPDPEAWERLADGAVGGAEEERLLGHLATCAACASRVAALPVRWPPLDRDAEEKAPSDDVTRRIVERLAGEEPVRERAPLEPPVIAGLHDPVEVGRGGMGAVYRARDERLERTVAVKVLAGSAVLSPDAHRRADREARILTRIAHPNIVQVFFVTESKGAPAIVMEWIDGPALSEHGRDARLAPRESARIVADLARAVAAVHACGIVHRDITPANVLLASDGGRLVPKLIDFGLARPDAEGRGSLTRSGIAAGTPSFMAPEQTGLDPALGAIGPATDIHGLGALLFWLLSGKAPYDASTTAGAMQRAAAADARGLSSASNTVPRDLRTIVEKTLAQRPERRYRSADALADDLERFLAHRPIRARRAGPGERVAKWARRHPAQAMLAACAAAATVALAVVSTHYVRGLERANVAITSSRDAALEAATLARDSFAKLTDSAAERFIARGSALDEADYDHLRRIREQYHGWPLEPDRAAALRFRAAGLERLARIFLRIARVRDAVESLGWALADFDALEAGGLATPDDERVRHDLELFHCGLLIGTDRLDEAAAAATAMIERLERRGESLPEAAHHLPGALSGLAIVESRRGRPAEAARHFRRSVDLCDRMVADAPDDVGILRLALPVYFNAASNPSFAGDDERHALLERLVALAEEGLARFDTDREFIASSATMGLSAMCDLDLARGRPEEALGHVRARALLAGRLAAEMPGSEPLAGEALLVANQAYQCHAALGRPGDAEEELAAAVVAARKAVAAEPAVVSRARVLGWLLESRASMERATGRTDAALATEQELFALIDPWIRGPGADPQLSAMAAALRGAEGRHDASPEGEAAVSGPSNPEAPSPH